MIRVCFAAGCYGHFLGQCLYYFTNLRSGAFQDLLFDDTGSSHDFRQNSDARLKIRLGHRSHQAKKYFDDTLEAQAGDSIITILTSADHWLDYMNNQFSKKYHKDLSGYLDDLVSGQELRHKFAGAWDCDHDLAQAPVWMQRELCSYMIFDMLRDGYAKDHCGFDQALLITTQDLFYDFNSKFRAITTALGLTIDVTQETLDSNHQRFVKSQVYHGSQLRCQNWVQQVLTDGNAPCPALTLFDEAYIQHLLREQGWEIRCHGLDRLDCTADHMRQLIYRS